MPESLARKISSSFIPIIFAEGHIMNSPFVAIVPLYSSGAAYGHMKPVSVRWFYKVEACIIIHMSLYVLSHITAWTQGRSLLPTLRNSGWFLTIPLNRPICRSQLTQEHACLIPLSGQRYFFPHPFVGFFFFFLLFFFFTLKIYQFFFFGGCGGNRTPDQ